MKKGLLLPISQCVLFFLIFSICPTAHAQTTLIAKNASWKYLDNNTRPSGWEGTLYNDGSWSTGNTVAGYGTIDGATVTTTVSYGSSSTNKYITTYFRKMVNLSATTFGGGLDLNLMCDDGCVIYINGKEAHRYNMPTGTISHSTLAPSAIGNTDEGDYTVYTVNDSFLVSGNNYFAVEVHQNAGNSSDLAFDLEVVGQPTGTLTLENGPYLQMAKSTGINVRWRTTQKHFAKVFYGTSVSNLNNSAIQNIDTTEHEVVLTGLSPSTLYYYAIGTTSDDTIQSGPTNFFKTPPTTGSEQATKIWVLGDCGRANTLQEDTRDAYYNYVGSNYTDLVLLLGDNAYNTGTDSEFENKFFEYYDDKILRQSPLWPAPGNHDYGSASPARSTNCAYFDVFTLPTAGESGGVSSGTEQYYSFDHANIHFLSLDSYGENGGDRMYDTSGAQAQWVKSDLAATNQMWRIAYWHHPPFTMGSHNSDNETELIQIREKFMALLDQYDVDMVLCGHSHNYERSSLIDGYYGNEAAYDSNTHAISTSSGRYNGTSNSCPYVKPEDNHDGYVYVVAGSVSAKNSVQGSYPHKAMYYSESSNAGSLVLDIVGNRLEAKFINENGVVQDSFTMLKDVNTKTSAHVTGSDSLVLEASWKGEYSWSRNNETTQSIKVDSATTIYYVSDGKGCLQDTFVINGPNLLPIALNDLSTIYKGDSTTYAVQSNDDPVDGDVLTTNIVNQPNFGSASLVGDSIKYVPNSSFEGLDTISYSVCDPSGGCDTALFVVHVQSNINNSSSNQVCWVISDFNDRAYKILLSTGQILDSVTTQADPEASTLNVAGDTLWYMNTDDLYFINLNASPLTSTLMKTDVDGVGLDGVMHGSGLDVADFDAMTIDMDNNIWLGTKSSNGAMIVLHPSNGEPYFDFFGSGQDYIGVPLPTNGQFDCMAIDPFTKDVFANLNDGGGSTGDVLYRINKTTGDTTRIAKFAITDIEGMGFTGDGRLIATTGKDATDASHNDQVWEIDLESGEIVSLYGTPGDDVEACDCEIGLPVPVLNEISGFVFHDVNNDTIYQPSGSDLPHASFTLKLYRDVNGNSKLDNGIDTLVKTDESNSNGHYYFRVLYGGGTDSFLVVADIADLPTNYEFTTDIYESAVFNSGSNTNTGNNFGILDTSTGCSGWVVFNDIRGNGSGNASYVTTIGYNNNTGFLKDSATGTALSVSMTGTNVNGNATAGSGANFSSGTDGYKWFNGICDMNSGFELNSSGADDIVTLDHLDPNSTYDIVLTYNRGNSGYTNRWTKITIEGASSYTNSSSSGVVTYGSNSQTVSINTGYNTNTGHVARWTNINPGSDSSFSVKSEWLDTLGGAKGYSMSIFRLQKLCPVPQPPVAVDDNASVNVNDSVTVSVLDNDSDPNSDPLTTSIVTQGSHGTASLLGNSIKYVPTSSSFTGIDTVVYRVCDNGPLCDTANVIIIISDPGRCDGNGWVVFNDMRNYNNPANASYVTTIGYNNDSASLKDSASGGLMAVRMVGSNVNGVNEQGSGGNFNAGTDAYKWFDGIIDIKGSLELASNVENVVTIKGLDPLDLYDIVLTYNRDNSGYTNRWTKISIEGADSYVNQSSPGVVTNGPSSVSINTGYNTITGYVARWTNISPGSDGSFSVKSEWLDTLSGAKGYAMTAFRLQNLCTAFEPFRLVGTTFIDRDISTTYNPSIDYFGGGAIMVEVYDDRDSNGVASSSELIDSFLTNSLGDYDISLNKNAYTHILVKVGKEDFHPTVRFTTDTLFAYDLRTISADSIETDFGFLGPRSLCFAVADMQSTDNEDELYMINRFSGKNKKIGDLGTTDVEAIAINNGMDTLYATDGDKFGWVNMETGLYTAIGPDLGNMNGEVGGSSHVEDISDIDGLTYDVNNDIMWATERRSTANDLLFQINRKTGQFVKDAFGTGADYLEITGSRIMEDVDDIAINGVTGNLYAINNQNNGDSSRLIVLNTANGTGTLIGESGVGDIEGMGFYNDGQFYGTTGIAGNYGYPHNALFLIDTSTGIGSTIDSFYSGGNDFEGCDCYTGLSVNLITGNVFFDADSNSVFNGNDTVFNGIKVILFRDVNKNGIIDVNDTRIDSINTNANGDYSFVRPDIGAFLVAPVVSGSSLSGLKTTTSDSITEDAKFVTYGQFDPHNDFGFSPTAGNVPVDPVPVSWLTFHATWDGKDVVLTWSTAQEHNSKNFIVERMIDHGEFEAIGSEDAVGFSNNIVNYSFIDYGAKPLQGSHFYYRLRQVDFDGRYDFSQIRLLQKEDKVNLITVTPVPFSSVLQVDFGTMRYRTIDISISNPTGQIVFEKSFLNNRTSVLNLSNLDHISAGVYLMRISYDGKEQLIKILK